MSDRQPQAKRYAYQHHMVWFAVFMLSMLVVATMAVLGNALYTYAHRSDCVIDLESGVDTAGRDSGAVNVLKMQPDSSQTAEGTGSSEPGNIGEQQPDGTQDTSVQNNTTDRSTAFFAQGASQVPVVQAQNAGMQVKDNDTVWATDTQVELFQTSYQNAAGEVTVRSGNTEHVIAPGTDGKYTFSLKNTGRRQMDYKVWVETEVTYSGTDFPLEARMSGMNGWLVGDDNTWTTTQGLDGVSEEASLSAGRSADYNIYWQWPFERGADEEDVAMGNLAADQEISCSIRIYTLAVDNGSVGGSHGSNGDSGNQTGFPAAIADVINGVLSPKTGDNTNIWWWIGWIVLAAAGITLCLYIRQRRKEQDEDRDGTDEDTDTQKK